MINVFLTITAWRRGKQRRFIPAVNLTGLDEIIGAFIVSTFTVLICSWAHEWAVKNCKADYIPSRLAGYWEKFSISNNRASGEPHWLR